MEGTEADETALVSGTVFDPDGPVEGATVRVRATTNMTLTDATGAFVLSGLPPGEMVQVTAWAEGTYVAATHITPTVTGVSLTLRPYHTVDHPDYAWPSPLPGAGPGACGDCHPMIVDQWLPNAHGSAVANPRFYSLYNGVPISGAVAAPPAFELDFPGTAGNCASCHAPGAGIDGYMTVNMNGVRDVITAGIHCDYCHKVGGVYLDSTTGSVYPNAPGALSQRLLRPPAGDNIFFGPYDDIPDPDARLPVMSESQFCAPCHQFSFWGTSVYASYEEWLASPYADQGFTCQDCHMPPTGDAYFATPASGGLAHPPASIPSHLQLGASAVELLQDTVEMTVQANQSGPWLAVTVILTNTGAGHHVPTDHPGRHLILTVEARDEAGNLLHQIAGGEVPAFGGDLAGRPGTAYAKVLREIDTGYVPSVSYWKPSAIVADNRLAAMAVDQSRFFFAPPDSAGDVLVTVQLIFRRLYQEIALAKDWTAADVLMEAATVDLNAETPRQIYVPLIAAP
jgi:hypothetical protein